MIRRKVQFFVLKAQSIKNNQYILTGNCPIHYARTNYTKALWTRFKDAVRPLELPKPTTNGFWKCVKLFRNCLLLITGDIIND